MMTFQGVDERRNIAETIEAMNVKRGRGVLRGFSRTRPSERGIAVAAGSPGVWELRCGMGLFTSGGRMRPASDTARRDVSPLLGESGGYGVRLDCHSKSPQ